MQEAPRYNRKGVSEVLKLKITLTEMTKTITQPKFARKIGEETHKKDNFSLES